jgi:hypothetical protein
MKKNIPLLVLPIAVLALFGSCGNKKAESTSPIVKVKTMGLVTSGERAGASDNCNVIE